MKKKINFTDDFDETFSTVLFEMEDNRQDDPIDTCHISRLEQINEIKRS